MPHDTRKTNIHLWPLKCVTVGQQHTYDFRKLEKISQNDQYYEIHRLRMGSGVINTCTVHVIVCICQTS